MAEHGGNCSDDENVMEVDDDASNATSKIEINNTNIDNHTNNNKNNMNGNSYNKEDQSNNNNNNQVDDVDDDELERLARINAEFNTNNLSEKPLKPKGKNWIFYIYEKTSIIYNILYIL